MMNLTPFDRRLAQLKEQLIAQGGRVVDLTLRAVEAYFERDIAKAASVVDTDSEVDRVDVQIERASIPLLAMGETDEHAIRSVFTIVKINNELERIAYCGVQVAEVVEDAARTDEKVPPQFRVMANSIIGMLRDANQALAKVDTGLAERVLAFDDTVNRFKTEITLDVQKKVAAGDFSPRFAFQLLTVAKSLERIADHCTNICEQLIYLESGRVVRHMREGWSKPVPPPV
jgi:phosphate transport system protein